jgi:hypothetical protein
MTKPKSPVKLSPRGILHGKQCPGIRGNVVDWTDHAFEEGILYPTHGCHSLILEVFEVE